LATTCRAHVANVPPDVTRSTIPSPISSGKLVDRVRPSRLHLDIIESHTDDRMLISLTDTDEDIRR
jgi:hypothetical protein